MLHFIFRENTHRGFYGSSISALLKMFTSGKGIMRLLLFTFRQLFLYFQLLVIHSKANHRDEV